MASLDVTTGVSQIVDAIVEGNPARVSASDLEDLLQWTAAPENPRAEAVAGRLRARGLEHEQARGMALALLERLLFDVPDPAPHRVLGLEPDASREISRDRYRLLMRIYHPDRSAGGSEWLHERSTRINEAYRRVQATPVPARSGGASPVSPVARIPRRRRRSRSRRRALRRRLGSVRSVRRRAILALVGVGSACIVYAFVANRAWESSDPAPADVVRTSP